MFHPHLDAEKKAGIFLDRGGGAVGVDNPQILQAAAQDAVGGQADRADVQESQQAGAVGRKDIIAHRAIVQETGAAGVHPGRGSGGKTMLVGMDGAAGAAVIKMAVQVNQAGGQQLAGNVDNPVGLGRIEAFSDGGHPAVAKSHIPPVVDPLARIQQRPAFQQQIVREGVGSHFCLLMRAGYSAHPSTQFRMSGIAIPPLNQFRMSRQGRNILSAGIRRVSFSAHPELVEGRAGSLSPGIRRVSFPAHPELR